MTVVATPSSGRGADKKSRKLRSCAVCKKKEKSEEEAQACFGKMNRKKCKHYVPGEDDKKPFKKKTTVKKKRKKQAKKATAKKKKDTETLEFRVVLPNKECLARVCFLGIEGHHAGVFIKEWGGELVVETSQQFLPGKTNLDLAKSVLKKDLLLGVQGISTTSGMNKEQVDSLCHDGEVPFTTPYLPPMLWGIWRIYQDGTKSCPTVGNCGNCGKAGIMLCTCSTCRKRILPWKNKEGQWLRPFFAAQLFGKAALTIDDDLESAMTLVEPSDPEDQQAVLEAWPSGAVAALIPTPLQQSEDENPSDNTLAAAKELLHSLQRLVYEGKWEEIRGPAKWLLGMIKFRSTQMEKKSGNQVWDVISVAKLEAATRGEDNSDRDSSRNSNNSSDGRRHDIVHDDESCGKSTVTSNANLPARAATQKEERENVTLRNRCPPIGFEFNINEPQGRSSDDAIVLNDSSDDDDEAPPNDDDNNPNDDNNNPSSDISEGIYDNMTNFTPSSSSSVASS